MLRLLEKIPFADPSMLMQSYQVFGQQVYNQLQLCDVEDPECSAAKYVHTHTCTHAHTHMHTRMHTYTHTCTHYVHLTEWQTTLCHVILTANKCQSLHDTWPC